MESTGWQLWTKAKRLIPGGSQLLSKRSEMFLPNTWPSYYQKAKGVEIWDLEGNKFIDMSIMGVGACTLGYADDDVNQAVKESIDNASMATLNVPEEVKLAEVLLELHPWAKMVRYARTGGEATSIAIRIARAFSGKDTVAFCGYHGWHDWYLASNLSSNENLVGHLIPGLEPNGVPKGLIGTALPFKYNDIEALKLIMNDNDIGVIIMEPSRHTEPNPGFLEEVRKIADENGVILIFDEISSGWRRTLGGIHSVYGVTPDIVVYGKAMSNGYPMSVVIGKENVMQAAQESFISSTYWTERIGPTAALATIRKMKKLDVARKINETGAKIEQIWKNLAEKHGLKIQTVGPNALITFFFEYDNKQEIKTLFTQEMLKRGFLASQTVYVSFAHNQSHLDLYREAVDHVFGLIKEAIDSYSVLDKLDGPVAHSGFARLT